MSTYESLRAQIEAHEAEEARLLAEVAALTARVEAAEKRVADAEFALGRQGQIHVSGNRNEGWRGDLIDPADKGLWFRSAGYDSRDAVIVTLVHWAVVNDVAIVSRVSR
jgi:hypothetical protein